GEDLLRPIQWQAVDRLVDRQCSEQLRARHRAIDHALWWRWRKRYLPLAGATDDLFTKILDHIDLRGRVLDDRAHMTQGASRFATRWARSLLVRYEDLVALGRNQLASKGLFALAFLGWLIDWFICTDHGTQHLREEAELIR